MTDCSEKLIDNMAEFAIAVKAAAELIKLFIKVYDHILISNSKAKRAEYLAAHSKKKRIRKKNLNRLQREVAKKIGL